MTVTIGSQTPKPKGGFEVHWVPVGKVKRYSNNPRKNAHAVQAVRGSLDEFGWRQPIVLDKNYVIVVGDTRFQAAVQRGDKEVPVHVASDLSPEQIAAYRIADNKVGELSDWDDSKLVVELGRLADVDFDLLKLGFPQAELDALLKEKPDLRVLENFEASPQNQTHWILMHGDEVECAKALAAIRKLKLNTMHTEYSGGKDK